MSGAAPIPRVERLGPTLWRATDRTGARYLIRPIRPEDAPAMQEAFLRQDPEDRAMRMHSAMARLPAPLARRLATIDPERDVCLVLEREDAPGALAGGARAMRDAAGDGAEFAVWVASALKGRGLGRIALETALAAAAEKGIGRVWGLVARRNVAMRGLARRLGMSERPDPDDPTMVIAETRLPLGGDAT